MIPRGSAGRESIWLVCVERKKNWICGLYRSLCWKLWCIFLRGRLDWATELSVHGRNHIAQVQPKGGLNPFIDDQWSFHAWLPLECATLERREVELEVRTTAESYPCRWWKSLVILRNELRWRKHCWVEHVLESIKATVIGMKQGRKPLYCRTAMSIGSRRYWNSHMWCGTAETGSYREGRFMPCCNGESSRWWKTDLVDYIATFNFGTVTLTVVG